MNSWREELHDELYHHGIKGQKWGIRRFQNEDGSLTEAGKERYHFSDETKKKVLKVAKTAGGVGLGIAIAANPAVGIPALIGTGIAYTAAKRAKATNYVLKESGKYHSTKEFLSMQNSDKMNYAKQYIDNFIRVQSDKKNKK